MLEVVSARLLKRACKSNTSDRLAEVDIAEAFVEDL